MFHNIIKNTFWLCSLILKRSKKNHLLTSSSPSMAISVYFSSASEPNESNLSFSLNSTHVGTSMNGDCQERCIFVRNA